MLDTREAARPPRRRQRGDPDRPRPRGLAAARPRRAADSAPVASGHKIARGAIAEGGDIVKFGQIIGYATPADRAPASTSTPTTAPSARTTRTTTSASISRPRRAAIPKVETATFQGYRRANGQVGTRNMIAVCATVNCSATVIRRAAEQVMRSGVLADYPNVDGVVAFAHGTGCGMAADGPGFDNLQRVLWGHATHPNVGAAVFVGLGCEVMQIGAHEVALRRRARRALPRPDHPGDRRHAPRPSRRIVDQIHALLPEVNAATREPVPASELALALQCGGSDGFSGITANPALGAASDLLVRHGRHRDPVRDPGDLRRRAAAAAPRGHRRRSPRS